VPGMSNCAPEPVQHRPGRLIGGESKDPMQRFGRDAIFSGGQMPRGRKTDAQRRSGVVLDCAGCGRDTTDTGFAPPSAPFLAPHRGACTIRANRAGWPSNSIKAVKTARVIRKPHQKFGVIAQGIHPSSWQLRSHLPCDRFHCLILTAQHLAGCPTSYI